MREVVSIPREARKALALAVDFSPVGSAKLATSGRGEGEGG